MKDIEKLKKSALTLLKNLIATPSFSSEEDKTAILIENWLDLHDIPFKRENNNIYAFNKYYDESKPNLLLNSHHDTVKPNSGYTKDPFKPQIEDGKLYGLGSNDAGGCLVSLLATFVYFYDQPLKNYNLIVAATAEEESSGPNGLNSLLASLPKIDVGIVGEPTLMDLAVAEKGLLVFDAKVHGTPSHAAHPNDNNSIYNTLKAVEWFRDYRFEKVSETLGEVKLTVTQINAGKQHNVVPATTELVIDCRVNDKYTNQEIVDIVTKLAPVDEIKPRTLRLGSSSIPVEHPLVQAGIAMGRKTYGSPTLSDQAVLYCPSLKLGPGYSLRSHTADEYIFVHEIEEGISIYIELLSKVL